jgi:peroxiredoxin
MSLINTTIKPFKTTAYHDGKFVPVTEANLKGQWSVVFFYPADFTFVCPTTAYRLTRIFLTKPGMTLRTRLAKFAIRCWAILPA